MRLPNLVYLVCLGLLISHSATVINVKLTEVECDINGTLFRPKKKKKKKEFL